MLFSVIALNQQLFSVVLTSKTYTFLLKNVILEGFTRTLKFHQWKTMIFIGLVSINLVFTNVICCIS